MSARPRRGLSLGARIFLVTALLIALSMGAAVVLTAVLSRGIARDAAAESLAGGAAAQEAFEAQRFEQLELASRLFVGDPALTAYLAEADTASVLDILVERQRDFAFDFAILMDPQGKVVARTDQPNAVGQDLSDRPIVARALVDFRARGVWAEGDDLYYAVVVPVQREFTAYGFLVAGFAIDDEAARDLKRVSGTDVAYVAAGEPPRIAATTLDPDLAAGLAAELRKRSGLLGEALMGKTPPQEELPLAAERWMARLAPLVEIAGDDASKPVGAAVALASLDRELAPSRRIQQVLLAAGLVSVLLALALSFLLSRRLLRPVRRLVAAAEAARQGNYDQRLGVAQGDEVGQLARSFDELLSELREKRDMEVYVAQLSKTLPEPVPAVARGFAGSPARTEVALLGIDFRRYARAGGGGGEPGAALERLSQDLRRVASAVDARRGRLEAVSGHRALASFEGEDRAVRALAAASEVLDRAGGNGEPGDAGEEEAPTAAIAAGRAVTGPVVWGEQAERAVVGLPVQQLENLLREAIPGELLLSREAHHELASTFDRAGYQLAERRGIVTPQPFYALTGAVANRLVGAAGAGARTVSAPRTLAGAAGQTLSGIAPGAVLGGRFEILAVLGSGGMGVVYKARDRELDDLVALKMLRRDLWGDASQLERLKSEIKLARKITHPNVLRTHDFGEIDGLPYISMEYVRGITLRFLLDEAARLPYSAGLRLAKQLCSGLAAAHAVGVMHRDIKPENLILEASGNAKLMDFGIARPIRRMTPGQTEAGYVVGTPQYLSPEQLQGHEVDARADIYSVGVVLYEVFTGRQPFVAPTPMDVIFKHLREPPVAPREVWPEIPPPLEAAILKCLEKDPDRRYRSVDALLFDLEALSA